MAWSVVGSRTLTTEYGGLSASGGVMTGPIVLSSAFRKSEDRVNNFSITWTTFVREGLEYVGVVIEYKPWHIGVVVAVNFTSGKVVQLRYAV